MISGSLNRCFPCVQCCGDTVQLFNKLILTKLLQFPGLILDFRSQLVRFGANLRNCFL